MEKIDEKKVENKFVFKTAKEIYDSDFEEEEMLINDLLPMYGLVLLSGPIKSGKSFFSLLLLNNISNGTEFLGQKINSKLNCLYISLEDSERRIQKRLKNMGLPVNDDLIIMFRWSSHFKGIDDLRSFLSIYPKIKVILIDTLGIFKGNRCETNYQSEYEFMNKIQNLTLEFKVLIIFTHHTRKQKDDHDIFNDSSGSIANSGSADTILLLERSRNSKNATLNCTGRDIEERKLKIFFNENCLWTFQSEIEDELEISPERQEILRILEEYGEMSPKNIQKDISNSSAKNISNLLSLMKKDGLVEQGAKHGFWKISNNLNLKK